ncbi:MAG: Ferrichrome-iron receptor [Rhodanobacteraceae bacterium]|jgi:catecholate siderophore receptor|nr:MAG: Ferrichrome-iron receptor [Rhodanobacteraceae bacterium]
MQGIKRRKHCSCRNGSRPLAFSTLVTGIALGLPALASGTPASPEASPTQLPTITVTGKRVAYKVDAVQSPKFTQPLLDTPQTINVIGKQIIQQQAATTLTETLRNSPGVGTFFVGENGSTSTGDAVYMRGFDASGSIFVDGVRDLGSISRDVFDTEQVELIKGPDGTVYGRTTPTGAINMVSKQPLPVISASATLGYGSWNQKRGTADLNQVLGEHAAFRLNVMDQDSGVPGRDGVKNDRWGIAPSLAFGLGTPTTVYLDFLHITQNNVPDGGVPTIGLPGYSSPDPARPFLSDAPRVDPSNFYGTAADHDHVKSDMATLIVHHDFSDNAALHDTLRWGRIYENYLLTSFMGNAANLLTSDPLDPSTWTIARSNPNFKDQTNRILTNQLNFTVNFDTGDVVHDLSTGIELTREQLGTGGYAALDGSAWSPANLYDPDPGTATGLVTGDNGTWSRARTDTAGVYAFDTMKFGERWMLVAGGRLDHYSTDFQSVVACGGRSTPACGTLPNGTPVPGLDADKRGNLASYKLGLVYKPAANGSVYANFATGAEPPGGNGLAFNASAGSADNPVFDPQKARTVEVGTKWNVFGDQLRLSAAVFRTVVSNLVAQDPVDLQYYQVGRERVQGVELGAVGQITAHWAVSAGYTLMNTHADGGIVSGATTSSAPATNGSGMLAYTPRSSFTAWSTWRLPHHLTLGAGARYSGEMQRGHDGALGTPQYTETYWVFDAMASYGINRHASLQLNVYNLFDKDYVAAINKSGYRYTPGAPRSAMLTLNIKY